MIVNDITVNGRGLDLPYTEKQDDLFHNHPEKFIVVPKGRRWGVTISALYFSAESLLNKKSVLWVDTIQANIDKYFYKYAMLTLRQIKPKYWSYKTVSKELRILDTQMDFRSAEQEQRIEGFGYHIIIINEAGIVLKGQKGRNLWFNTIYPMIMDYGDRAQVFFLGTPKGKKAKKDEKIESNTKFSLYYELACKGGLKNSDYIEKHPNYKTLTFTSYDNPMLRAEDIKELEADVPPITRKQEIHGKFCNINDEPIFKRSWFHIVHQLPPVHTWLRKVISIDSAFKKGAENDDSAMVCWLETTVGYFWTDCLCKKLNFPELLLATKKFYNDNEASLVLIEDKASGQSLVQMFEVKINENDFGYSIPVLPIQANSDKLTRSVATTPMYEGGMISVLYGTWNDNAIDQMCEFNALLDTPDDICDANAQILNYFKGYMPQRQQVISRKVERRSKILVGYPK